MLVSEIIDRTYSEWLEPGGINRPAWDTVATIGVLVGTAEGTFTVTGRQSAIPSDTLLEIDDELIATSGVAGTTVTTNGRGYRETGAVAHSAGAKVFIDPKFPRIVVFDALKNIMQRLYPHGLYQRVTNGAFNWDTRQVQALDSGALDVLSVIVRVPGSYEQYTDPLMEGRDYRVLWEFTPPKLRMIQGGYGSGSQAVTCIIKKDFTQPSSTADDLDTLGVPTSLQPSIPMAVAGWLLQGREIPRVQIENIQRQLASQGIQVGSALNVGQALLNQFWNGPVADERRRQFERDPTKISVRKTG
jgi:hypothetical protein